LTIRTDLRDDLSDLWLESHVQPSRINKKEREQREKEKRTNSHAIGFIEDEVSNTTQVRGAEFQVINETTRGSDDNLYTSSQFSVLCVLWNSTVYNSVLDLTGGTKLVAFLLDLKSELSRWGKNQHNWTITMLQVRLFREKRWLMEMKIRRFFRR
jgi:hypothetical protein